jgi:PiT family inorganic phosphate transporter
MLAGMVIIAVAILSFANGANDNFKGVATIYGSGTASYRTCVVWATITTLAGSVLAPVLAGGLIQTFRAKGLVPDSIAVRPEFLGSAALAAGVVVLSATRFGMPVSTTHALTGGLIGAGLVAAGGDVDLSVLQRGFLAPLLISPVLAMTLVMIAYPLARLLRRGVRIEPTSCVCVGAEWVPTGQLVAGGARLIEGDRRIVLTTGTRAQCQRRYDGAVLGIDAQRFVDAAHFLTAGAVCFARGLNDTPKLLAMVMVVEIALPNTVPLGAVSIAIALGGLLGARRVAETVGKKITPLDPGQGLVANASTASLVIAASIWQLPVSTTHVSTGCIFGIGVLRRTAQWRVLGGILLAWLTTLPLAAVVGAVLYSLIRYLH